MKLLYTLLLLSSFTLISAQELITFEKTYGTSFFEEGKSVKQCLDGGFIIGGTNLIKTSDEGIIEWMKPYTSDYVNLTVDTGFILIHSYGDIYLTKLNKQGDTLWTSNYEEGLWAREGFAVEQTLDGGYIVSGRFQDFSGSGMMLLKMNQLGQKSWRYTWSEPTSAARCYGQSVHQTSDKGYVVAGYTFINAYDSTFHKDIYIVKTDSLGLTEWEKNYGGPNDEYCWEVQETFDGNYILAGSQYDSLTSMNSMYLLKLDESGEIVWTRNYEIELESELRSVWQTYDKGYILAGNINAGGGNDIKVIKVDSEGEIEWTKDFGGAEADRVNNIQQTADLGYILTGSTKSLGEGGEDVYLIKMDSLGEIDITNSIAPLQSSQISVKLYPNPTSGFLKLNSMLDHAELSIFSAEGKQIHTSKINYGEQNLSLAKLPKGVYFYVVQQQSKVLETGKIILE